MPKSPLSVTLDQNNLLWLKGRAAAMKRRSLSEALDDLIAAARNGGPGASAIRSVVGTIDIAAQDSTLDEADTYVRATFAASLNRPFLARETPPVAAVTRRRSARKGRRG